VTKLFADRAFLTINGFEALHVKSSNLQCSENMARVSTMTRNRRDAGFKFGNRSIQITAELEIEADRAQIDLALAKGTVDIGLVYECGGERYTATGIRQGSFSLQGSVGEGSKSLNLEALDLVNENGSSVNTDISLG
jgi:hypothetical protein